MKIEGETAIFNCTVDGNPEPSIDWTKDNVTLNITADPDLSQSNSGKVHSLEIRNVYRSDKGQYRCVANNNSIGSATSLAGTLSVHCKYHFVFEAVHIIGDLHCIAASTIMSIKPGRIGKRLILY